MDDIPFGRAQKSVRVYLDCQCVQGGPTLLGGPSHGLATFSELCSSFSVLVHWKCRFTIHMLTAIF